MDGLNENGRYVEKQKDGSEVVRFAKPKSKAEFNKQLEQFGKDAKAGKLVCLSDLMCNAGM